MTRPLSPHLRIFRFPPTAVLSILHRVTGVLLTLGLPVWVFWLMQVADGPSAYEPIHAFLQSSGGIGCLYLWLFALFTHLCHGLRHLFWDSGKGMLRESLHRYAMLEFSAAVILTGGCYGLHLEHTEFQTLPAADWRGEPARRWTPSAYGCDKSTEPLAPDFGEPVIRCSALVDFFNSKPGPGI